ncbi:MAG: LptE family protein [Acidobacteria bacterium]|nr:LptE family protein [Acidobacteriota bacterium]
MPKTTRARTGRRAPAAPSAAVVLLFALGCTSCGYTLAGRGSFLPEYIETIGIPTFENRTPVFEVERLLTQEVRTAFIGRGSYRVQTDESGAQARLSGSINNITIQPASFSAEQQASRYVLTLTASIEFVDLTTNEVIWSNTSLIFSEEYDVASGAGDVSNASAFFGQRSNAVERMATDFATTVVSSILEAF